MNKQITKALQVADLLNIKVKLVKTIKHDNRGLDKKTNTNKYEVAGQWMKGRTIFINPDIADAYTILHEVGHVINGYMCCREHCEYAAHGAAIALAKVFKIRLPTGSRKKIDVYAGRSSHKACGAITK